MMRLSLSVFCAVWLFSVCANATEPHWNQIHGPNHDNKSFSTGIARSWSKEGPPLLWKIENLGAAYSNLAFFDKTMYTMGDVGGKCLLFSLDAKTGNTNWAVAVGRAGNPGQRNGPRATPVTDGQRVFAYGQYGDLLCVDAKTGEKIWSKNVVEDWGAKFANVWGYSTSPILDGEQLVLPIGGEEGTLIAFDKDGKVIWRSKELKDGAPYPPVVPAVFGGVRQYLLFSNSGLYGVEAASGKILWGAERPSVRPVCTVPVVKDDLVLIHSADELGTNIYRISKQGDQFAVEQVFEDQTIKNLHRGNILVGNHVYFNADGNFTCMDITTGEVAWTVRSIVKFSLTYVDGLLILRSEMGDGPVVLVEPSPEGYKEKGRFDRPERTDFESWTYPIVVNGRLYLRDQHILFCYDLMPSR
jgi:outer membrane protein assembly factor BamB